MSRLAGKVIVLTGAAGDIGAAVAAAVRREGGRAITTDLAGRPNVDHALDVTSESGWEALKQSLAQSEGAIDGLVNCAGIGSPSEIDTIDYAHWRHVMAVNLDGTFLGCKAMLPLMRARGGSIVNLGSIFGLVGRAGMLAYSASKGGVVQMTRSLAMYGASLKPQVRCNAICPAFIEGQMTTAFSETTSRPELVRQVMAREIPLGRFGLADEVAALAVYLLSDEARFVTGTEIPIDGGYTAR